MGKRSLGRTTAMPPANPGKRSESDGQRRLVARANTIYTRERYGLKPRILIARERQIEEIDAIRYAHGLGQDGLMQVAAVLVRTAAPHELVALLGPSHFSGVGPFGPLRPGAAMEHSALLLARSADGERFTHVWHLRPNGATKVEIFSWQIPDAADAQMPDFADPGMWVDPVLEETFAELGLPGARSSRAAAALLRPPPPSERPSAVSPAVPASAPVDEAPSAPVPRAEDDAGAIAFPWGAVGPYAAEIGGGSLLVAGARPLIAARAGRPPRFAERSLDDLVVNGWTTEAQAVQLTVKLREARDRKAALAVVLGSKLPARAKLFACARAAYEWATVDPSASHLAAEELVARIDAAIAGAGGVSAWIARQWPAEVGLDEEIGLVSIAAAATAAYWRFAPPMIRIAETHAPTTDAAVALDAARSLRDGLLDRAGAAPGSASVRVTALGRKVLPNVASPLGERRPDRWDEALAARSRQAPDLMVRDYATFHVTALHTVITVNESVLARVDAIRSGDLGSFRPEDTDLAGLLEPAPLLIARDVVIKAAMLAGKEGDATAPAVMTLLECARRMAPWDPMILGCWNQARFARGDRGAALLDDLATELRDQPSLGAAAEALSVAEALGRPRASRVLSTRIVALAEKTPHRWVAEARALFTRPSELARIDRVEALLARAPGADVPRDEGRALFALYGPDPERALAELRGALAAQKEALEWAALIEEVGEEAIAPAEVAPAAREDAISAAWLDDLQRALRAIRPIIAQAGAETRSLAQRAAAIERAAGEATEAAHRVVVDGSLTGLLADATARAALVGEPEPEPSRLLGAVEVLGEEDDGFRPMQVAARALERSRRDLGTPEWALQEGLRLLAFYNLSRGRRDRKMLQGTRDEAGALWELRHRDARHPVRVLYRAGDEGPRIIAILAKQDDAHQRRVIERVRGWALH